MLSVQFAEVSAKSNRDMIPIFEMSEEEIDDFIVNECGAPINVKTHKAAAQAFRGWIEEYYSEGNLSTDAFYFFERIMKRAE